MEPTKKKSLLFLHQGIGFDSTEIVRNVFSDVMSPAVKSVLSFDSNLPHVMITSTFSGCPYKKYSGSISEKYQSKNLITEMIQMIDDEDDSVRSAAYIVLKRASELKNVEQLMETGAIPALIRRLLFEDEHAQVTILEILQSCCLLDVTPALDAGVMYVLPKLLKHPLKDIRLRAVDVIKILCLDPRGRTEACESGLVPLVLDLLADKIDEIQATALATVLLIAEAMPETLIASAQNVFRELSRLLKIKKCEVRRIALQVFAALIKSLRGKTFTLLYTEQILLCTYDKDSEVQRLATSILNAVQK